MASIVLFLLIIFCLLKWEGRGTHFGYMYIIFAYWNESRWARTLDMYIIIFAYWNESRGACALDMYIIFAYWNECGGWHSTLNMTHPWAKRLIRLVPHDRWRRQSFTTNGPCFLSLSLSKLEMINTHKHNVVRSPTSHKFHNSKIHWPPCGFHTCKIHPPTNQQHSNT